MRNKAVHTDKLFSLFTIVLLSSFSILLYLNTIHGKFVYDDFKIIVENSFIREWKYFPKIFTNDYFFISGEMSYRPLVTISYFIDYAIWHLNPLGFHLTNIVLHTGNVILFYLFLSSILQNKKVIFLSTLFFVTHLLLVETVNAIGYREDLLSATFMLISLMYFIKSDNSLSRENSQKSRFTFFYTISLIAYACGLFSKEMAITLPALLPLFIIFSKQRLWPSMVKRLKGIYTGYIAISLFYLIIRFIIIKNPLLKVDYQSGGFWTNIFTMIKILASYIKLSFFPYDLNADYVVPLVKTPQEWSSILSITFIISVFIVFVILCKLRNILACWISWFLITLLPVMNIIPIGNIMAERYLYIPVMGFCVVKGILIYRITDPTLSAHAIRLRKVVQIALVLIMIGGYGGSIIHRNGYWRDELTLWTKTIQHSPNSQRAHCNLGNVYMESGLIERAQAEYQTALSINPQNANVHSNLGIIYSKQGMLDKAFAEYKEAIQLDNNYAQPHNNLGNIYFNLDQIDKAKREYEEALRIKPNYSHAHNGLGSVYDTIGELDKALEEFKKSLYYDNCYIHAINNLGINYAKRGQWNEAIAEFKRAIELDASQAQGHYNLGLAYEKSGKTIDAINEYNTVVQLNPTNFNAHYALGVLYESLGLADKAIDEFQKIVMIHPKDVNTYRKLIFLYIDNKKDAEMARYYVKELLKIDPSQAQKDDIKQLLNRFMLTPG